MNTDQGWLHKSIVFISISAFLILSTGSSPSWVNASITANTGRALSMPPPPGWYTLPNHGLDDGVFALEGSGDNLYVGGSFDATGDGWWKDLGHIARSALDIKFFPYAYKE